jgi:cellobiose phosphorylase
MGGGDWNDSMNLVGRGGKGESVWLGFFLCAVLRQFADVARVQGDERFAQRCEHERARLGQQLEAQAWDGSWYRRAYFDDGTPLGSKDNIECQVDSIAQSWAVLSGVVDPERARLAMAAIDGRLARAGAGVVALLDPPFDRAGPCPGYISGYPPGVRENGGQYTHAAVWAAMAFAELGDTQHAWSLLHIINPVHHGRTIAEVNRYKLEPYVVAADVDSVAPHTGRGGWSWYTGSAGWLYRLLLESLLGLRLEATRSGALLHVAPCLPPEWTGFTVDYRFRDTPYRLRITAIDDPGATTHVVLDGATLAGGSVPLVDDGKAHAAEVRLATPSARSRPPRGTSISAT